MDKNNKQEGKNESFKDKVVKDFLALKDVTVRYANIARRKLDLSHLRKDRDELFKVLGKEIYTKHSKENINLNDFETIFKKIDEKCKEYDRLERDIRKTEPKKK